MLLYPHFACTTLESEVFAEDSPTRRGGGPEFGEKSDAKSSPLRF
jgi:hypothetical protein